MRPAPAMGAPSAKQPTRVGRPVAAPKGARPKATVQNMLGRSLRVVGSDWALLAPSLLAGLFERSALELWIGLGRNKAQKLLKEIRDRFALPAGQLILGRLPRSLRRHRPKASIRVCQAR